MGFTPVEGLMMGTRTGDLDLGVLTYILKRKI
jgi:acetate kinase